MLDGVYRVFRRKPQVVFARFFPTDIIVEQKSFIIFWQTMPASWLPSLTCLNFWGGNESVCEVTYGWFHTLATPREYSSQTKTFLSPRKHDISKITVNSTALRLRFRDYRNHRAVVLSKSWLNFEVYKISKRCHECVLVVVQQCLHTVYLPLFLLSCLKKTPKCFHTSDLKLAGLFVTRFFLAICSIHNLQLDL